RETKRNINVLKRVALIQDIVRERHEVGNQSKSKRQVWRYYVNSIYPMSERSFYRYMGMNVKQEIQKTNYGQMSIEFNG
ncbi:hypothetical protein, partial [Dysgonomonas sp. ZJ279]|uniref:hypothetical protein n=1 Tax=Dysgonomonas sp. ZJ279 TaxID=2709796 RepID=UPI001C86FB0D